MTHTNVNVRDRLEERKQRCLVEAERKFWCDLAHELQLELENIPEAVRKFGQVTISDGSRTITLVEKQDDAA